MIAPISWLKDYIEITLEPKKLGERLTETGLGVEKIVKEDTDVIFDLEITPNRPDLLSILGIAREIGAVEEKKVKYPKIKTDTREAKLSQTLPLEIKTDYKINPRFTGIIITGITVKESPRWLQERLRKIGQKSINNIVDITNYVMFEMGNPIHAFDYDKIAGKTMTVTTAGGGEEFKSVDSIVYRLPKGAVIIKDKEKIIDLCGIKGGYNSGTFPNTKTVFIRVPVEIPGLIRRTSLALGLRSDASGIFERRVNEGGTVDALNRCTDLILELAGGKIAGNLYDLKEKDFTPWKIKLSHNRLTKIVGIDIAPVKVKSILDNLNLATKVDANAKDTIYTVNIPTYRNDLIIEEDIIEEVARIYGYNNFPKTISAGQIPTVLPPYFKDYNLDKKVKDILTSCGFSEIYTYSLVGEREIAGAGFNPENVLRIDNPVSREYEYLRPTLKIGLNKALLQNIPNFKEINLFELGKVYLGKNLSEVKERYFLSGISNQKNYFEIKGIIETIFEKFGIKDDPVKYIEPLNDGVIFELNFSEILAKANLEIIYKPIPKYPPIIEDLALAIDPMIKTTQILDEIKKQSNLITEVSLLDKYKNNRTFHIVYQDKNKNLTNEEIISIREKILKKLNERFNAKLTE